LMVDTFKRASLKPGHVSRRCAFPCECVLNVSANIGYQHGMLALALQR
jgi:hypothetical protein